MFPSVSSFLPHLLSFARADPLSPASPTTARLKRLAGGRTATLSAGLTLLASADRKKWVRQPIALNFEVRWSAGTEGRAPRAKRCRRMLRQISLRTLPRLPQVPIACSGLEVKFLKVLERKLGYVVDGVPSAFPAPLF